MAGKVKGKMPSTAAIIAWLGIIATVIGIITGIISLTQLAQKTLGGKSVALSDQDVGGTLAALQSAKDRAELQLTSYALAEQQSANQSTLNAVNQAQANFQATLDAVNGKQDALVNTQNAISSLADAANATATQNAINAGATNAVIAQVPPTDTPQPTSTPTPAPVADYRLLTAASITVPNKRTMQFSVQTTDAIPNPPPNGLAYAWQIDSDHDAATGLPVQDIGVDILVMARYDNGAWVGTLRSVQTDGSLGQAFLFVDIKLSGNSLTATIDPTKYRFASPLNWIAHAQSDQETYPLLPTTGHFSSK